MSYEQLLQRAYEQIPKKGKEEVRLEIPQPDSFVQGTKTIIKNFAKLCEVTRREQGLLLRFFSKEFATSAVTEGERLLLNKKVDNISIGKKFDQFVKTYVLCKECGKPDTHFEDLERGFKVLRCEACGARNSVAVKF